MKPLRHLAFGILFSFASLLQAQSPAAGVAHESDREKLIGAWHLVELQSPGPDGRVAPILGLKGTLIYTRDGHMSVQIMYPVTYPASTAISNDYVLNGYEASFGTYEIDPARHTVTHHVQGSITHGLVGKSLVRAYRFTPDGRLLIHSIRQDEHWSVTWQHD